MADLNMADILRAMEAMTPDEKRRFALQAVEIGGLKVATDTRFSRAVADSRDMVFGGFPIDAVRAKIEEIPENVLYTLLSQGNGEARGSAGIIEIPTKAKGVTVKVSVQRKAEAVPVKDKHGKEIKLPSGATKTEQVYEVTECALTLDAKGRLPRFVEAAPESEEESETDEDSDEATQ